MFIDDLMCVLIGQFISREIFPYNNDGKTVHELSTGNHAIARTIGD